MYHAVSVDHWPMPYLQPVELQGLLPAEDFELSKQFYQDLVVTLYWGTSWSCPPVLDR